MQVWAKRVRNICPFHFSGPLQRHRRCRKQAAAAQEAGAAEATKSERPPCWGQCLHIHRKWCVFAPWCYLCCGSSTPRMLQYLCGIYIHAGPCRAGGVCKEQRSCAGLPQRWPSWVCFCWALQCRQVFTHQHTRQEEATCENVQNSWSSLSFSFSLLYSICLAWLCYIGWGLTYRSCLEHSHMSYGP